MTDTETQGGHAPKPVGDVNFATDDLGLECADFVADCALPDGRVFRSRLGQDGQWSPWTLLEEDTE